MSELAVTSLKHSGAKQKAHKSGQERLPLREHGLVWDEGQGDEDENGLKLKLNVPQGRADQFEVEIGCPHERLLPDQSEHPEDDHNVADTGTLVLCQAQLLHHYIGGRRWGGHVLGTNACTEVNHP